MSLLACAIMQVSALSGPQFDQQGLANFVIDTMPEHIALVDFPDLSCCARIEVRQGELLLNTPDRDVKISFSGESILWTVADCENNGLDEFVVLVDGQKLQKLVLDPQSNQFSWELVVDGLGGRHGVPRGLRPASFVRDIDHDGLNDLIIPVGEKVELWFGDRSSANGFSRGPLLKVASNLILEVGALRPNSLLGKVRRSLRIPAIDMSDISGDGRSDLLVTSEGSVNQYISDENGLPNEPTATVNLEKFQDRLPELKFDPGNIAALTKFMVMEEWLDLNQDGALDLIVLAGGTIIVYMGGEQGLDLRRPRDQMPTRGNVLFASALLVDDDQIPDLVLLRIEDLSLARVFSFIFMDVKIEFDILAYKGRGDGRFQKRPLPQSKSVKIKLPSILDFAAAEDEAEEVRHSVYRLADFDGDGLATDLVAMDSLGGIKVWNDVVESNDAISKLSEQVLSKALKSPKEVEFDMQAIGKWAMGRTSLLASLADSQKVSATLPAPKPNSDNPQTMTIKDVDGDGKDEVLIFRKPSPTATSLKGIIWSPFLNR